MSISAADITPTPLVLTEKQHLRLASLLGGGHQLVGARNGSPIVQGQDGQLLLLQPNGRLAATTLIQRVQSYLHIGQG